MKPRLTSSVMRGLYAMATRAEAGGDEDFIGKRERAWFDEDRKKVDNLHAAISWVLKTEGGREIVREALVPGIRITHVSIQEKGDHPETKLYRREIRATLDDQTCSTCRTSHGKDGPIRHVCEHIAFGGICRCVETIPEGVDLPGPGMLASS